MATRWALPAVLLGTILGILASDAHATSTAVVAACVLLVTAALVALAKPGSRLTVLAIGGPALALGLCFGALRGGSAALPAGPGSISALVGQGEARLSGALSEDPRPKGSDQQVILDQVAVIDGDRGVALRGRLLVRLPRALELSVGDRVGLVARVEAPEAFDGFDYPAFLARQGIGGIARVHEASLLEHGDGGLIGAPSLLRGWLLSGLNDLLPEPEAALGAGILLGVRAGIAPEVSAAFATAGLTHVVAISGWNIAIVAALIGTLTRRLETRRGGRLAAGAASTLAVAGYVVLSGASPSVVRAALMAGAMLFARTGGSRAHATSALLLAALLMLLAAPNVLWDVGFQLSSLATAGLIWFGAPIESRLAAWPAWLREPVALTLAAQVTTLPVILATFGRLSLVAPLANVVVAPMVPAVMAATALAAPIGALQGTLPLPLIGELAAWLAAGTAWLLLRAMIGAAQVAAALPFAALSVAAPPWLPLAWYPAVWLFARRRQHRSAADPGDPVPTPAELGGPRGGRLKRQLGRFAATAARPPVVAACLVTGLLTVSVGGLPDGRLHLTMLDVGQGDAILVESPSGVLALIDGGPDPDLLLQRLGEVLPWWQRRIDLVILTHPHQDHVGGLPAVLERYQVALVLDPGRAYPNPAYPRFLDDARHESRGRLLVGEAGQRLQLGPDTSLTVLFPAPADRVAPLPASDINNASIVTLLQSGGFAALLTGDAESPVEALLLQRGLIPAVDLLKVGHHGSNSSTSLPLLAVADPQAALVSVGAGNDYGHPHRVTLDHLASVPGLRLHRTDREGTIEVVSDGTGFAIHSHTTDDGWRLVRHQRRGAASGSRTDPARPGSIAAWLCLPAPKPRRCSHRSTCRTASCCTPAGSAGWRRPRPASSRARGSRWTRISSRSPPCCTTSTRWRRGAAGNSTASSVPAG